MNAKKKLPQSLREHTGYLITDVARLYLGTVYRDDETVDIYVQKVKQSWLGQKGFSTYRYNTGTRQYEYISCSRSLPKPKAVEVRDFTEAKRKEMSEEEFMELKANNILSTSIHKIEAYNTLSASFNKFMDAFKESLGEETVASLTPRTYIHLFIEYIFSLFIKR